MHTQSITTQLATHDSRFDALESRVNAMEEEIGMQTSTKAKRTTTTKAAGSANKAIRKTGKAIAKRSRPRTETTKWVADKRARRVPLFVIELTKLDTKKKIVAKYGANARFEMGKALPKPLNGIKMAPKLKARTPKAKAPAAPPIAKTA